MNEPDSNIDTGLALSCPACGDNLTAVPGSEELLGCPGARLLEEQQRLVRAIATQLWDSQSLAAFKLEGQADRLRETTGALRQIITEGVLQNQPLKEVHGTSAN